MKYLASSVAVLAATATAANAVSLHARDSTELMTYYGDGSGGDSAPFVEEAGACGTSYHQKPSNYFVAVNKADYSSSLCGKCAQIVYGNKCTVAPIVDELPDRDSGLDLSHTVFGNLVGGYSSATDKGVIYASWSVVSCPSYIGITGETGSNDDVCSGYDFVTSGVSHGSSSSSSNKKSSSSSSSNKKTSSSNDDDDEESVDVVNAAVRKATKTSTTHKKTRTSTKHTHTTTSKKSTHTTTTSKKSTHTTTKKHTPTTTTKHTPSSTKKHSTPHSTHHSSKHSSSSHKTPSTTTTHTKAKAVSTVYVTVSPKVTKTVTVYPSSTWGSSSSWSYAGVPTGVL